MVSCYPVWYFWLEHVPYRHEHWCQPGRRPPSAQGCPRISSSPNLEPGERKEPDYKGSAPFHSQKIIVLPISTSGVWAASCVLCLLTEPWPGRHSGSSTPGRGTSWGKGAHQTSEYQKMSPHPKGPWSDTAGWGPWIHLTSPWCFGEEMELPVQDGTGETRIHGCFHFKGAEGPTGASPPLTEELTRCPGLVSMWALQTLASLGRSRPDNWQGHRWLGYNVPKLWWATHTAFWGPAPRLEPYPKSLKRTLTRTFLWNLGGRKLPCLSTFPREDSSPVTQLIILWTMPVSHWPHSVLRWSQEVWNPPWLGSNWLVSQPAG